MGWSFRLCAGVPLKDGAKFLSAVQGPRFPLILAALASLFNLILPSPAHAQVWRQVFPPYESDNYSGISCAGRDTVYITGPNFFLQRSVDRGAHWETLHHTLDAMHIQMCGYDGSMLWLQSGGKAYSDAVTADTAHAFLLGYNPSTDDTTRAILPMPKANLSTLVLSVGKSAIFLMQRSRSCKQLHRSVDNGLTWTVTAIPDSLGVISICVRDSLRVLLMLSSKTDGSTLYSTADGGRTLRKNAEIRFNASQNGLEFPVAWIDDTSAIAVPADNTPYLTRDGGETWTSTNAIVPAVIKSIRMAHSGVGYVCGSRFEVLRTTDFGASWMMLRGASTKYDDCMAAMINDSSAVFIQKSGNRISTTDAGLTWSDEQINPFSHVVPQKFNKQDEGYIDAMLTDNTNDNFHARTSDGGRTWIPFECPNGRSNQYIHTSSSTSYAIASGAGTPDTLIFKSTDRGLSWTGSLLDTLVGFSDKTVWAIDNLSRGDDTVFVPYFSKGTLVWTTNGGRSWRCNAIPRFNMVDMRWHTYSWAITDSLVMRSPDDGLTWEPMLTLPNEAERFEKLIVFSGESAAVISRRRPMEPYTVSSLMSLSTDAGATWTTTPIRFESIRHTDREVPFLTVSGFGLSYLYSSYLFGGSQLSLIATEDLFQTFSKREIMSTTGSPHAYFKNRDVVWLTVDGRIYVTTSGGIDAADFVPTPTDLELAQNHPNPFTSITSIQFGIRGFVPRNARLELYDILGRRVRTLFDGLVLPGEHHVSLQATDLLPGVYFVRLTSDETSVVRKIMRAR